MKKYLLRFLRFLRFLLFSMTLFWVNSLSAKTVEEWEKDFMSLSIQERSSLVNTFAKGIPYDLSYTLTAIQLKESTAGRYQLNVNKKNNFDCGIFQNNTTTVLKREKRKINKYNVIQVCQRLILNKDYAFEQTLQEIAFWKRVHKGNFKKIWGSYNGGYRGNKAYAKDISNIIKVLKKYFSLELYNKHRETYKEDN